MTKARRLAVLPLVTLILFATLSDSATALGQGSSSQSAGASDGKLDKINFEVQLHLLVASNERGETGNIPQSLEAVVKQLKSSLPFANYRLAATFVNRVKDGGTLEVKGVVSSDSFTNAATNPFSQTFYEFTLFQVKSGGDGANQPSIDITKFRFGLRLPITTGVSHAEGTTASYPIINYEPTGITTEMTLREGTPTVVGTMTTSRPGQILILVVSIKRTL